MKPIIITGFQGENQALDDTLLPESVGVESLNQQPGFGDMRPWLTPGADLVTVPSVKTIWRIGQDATSDTDYWMTFNNAVSQIGRAHV